MFKQYVIPVVLIIGVYVGILPWIPNEAMGPYHVLNPHEILKLVWVMCVISIFGNMAMQWIHLQHAILWTGFLGGFSSSTATIAVFAGVVKEKSGLANNAAAAAIASNVATYLQLSVLIGVVSPATLMTLIYPLLVGCGMTMWFCYHFYDSAATTMTLPNDAQATHASTQSNAMASQWQSLKRAFIVVVFLSGMLLLIAALQAQLGNLGINLAAMFSGLVDGHASAISLSEMVSLGHLQAKQAAVPILIGLTSNTVIRNLVAITSHQKAFFGRVMVGLLVPNMLVWMTLGLITLLGSAV